jgi:hypothetical protein
MLSNEKEIRQLTVRIKERPCLLRSRRLGVAHDCVSGIVHDDIDTAKAVHRRLESRIDCLQRCDVECDL